MFSVKNNLAVKGQPLTCGSAFLAGYEPIYTATVVARVLSAGGKLIGHCNMDEFATGGDSLSSSFSPCLSPWGEDSGETDLAKRFPRIPGGSSSGGAVSVVTGQCDVSLGSDTGGSIRLPAAYCGLVGLKPSYGALSRHGLVPLASSLDCPGILGRDVRSVSRVFDVVSGPDPLDSTSVRIPDYYPSNHTLRIGLFYSNAKVEECVKTRLEEALEDLKSEYDVTTSAVELPHFKHSILAYNIITGVEAHSNMSKYIGILYGNGTTEVFSSSSTAEEPFCARRNSLLGTLIKFRILYGTFLSSREGSPNYEQACRMRRAVANDFKLLNGSGGYDVIITPSTTDVAPRSDVIAAMGAFASNDMDLFWTPANLAGLPAVSVPIGVSPGGLPLGLQVIGAWGRDRQVLEVAEMVESSSRHSARVRESIARLCALH